MTDAPSSSSRNSKRVGTCSLCAKSMRHDLLVSAHGLRPTLNGFMTARHESAWGEDSLACKACLAKERYEYMMDRLVREKGELSSVEKEIAEKASQHQTLATDLDEEFEAQTTRGQRLADRVAAVGGSWPFVAGFLGVLAAWIALNSLLLRGEAFDPYPYILMNLILSCLAAIQAPIIMMSQNRVSARDRMQANQDFRINLKAELEIATLHEKVDHLLHSQWEHLVELQEMQIDLLNELTAKRK